MQRFILAFLLALALPLAWANTEALQEAGRLFRQGQHASALTRIDAYLANNPKDAQGRFLKGLILTEMNRHQDAIKVFSDLTVDYPQLPEPYNNLAVLYAAQGQYERAKQNLEQAIRTHPSYATAHENLGDIYAKMASLAYDRALQLDESNVSAQTKLALIRELFNPTRSTDLARTEAAAAAKTAPKTTARPSATRTAARQERPSAPATPAPASAAEEVSPEAAASTDATVIDGQATAPARPGPAAPAHTPDQAKAAIEQTIRDWAAAWSRQDVPGYLAFYAANFVPQGGQSRSAWEEERRTRLTAPRRIRVEVSGLRIEVKGDKAQARFRQRYESDRLRGSYTKTLDLEFQDGSWKIVRER